MEIIIRNITACDTEEVAKMMKTFYSSPAVLSCGSDEIFKSDIENCVNGSPYLEGYVFESDAGILGYAMVAKSFSTEFGKPCIWIEDLYIKDGFRGLGIGTRFFSFIEKRHAGCVFRLEVEAENERAVGVYKKCGYEMIPYSEMIKKWG